MSKKSSTTNKKYYGYTVEELKNVFEYYNGELYWKMQPRAATPLGSVISGKSLEVSYKNKHFYKQFIIFFIVHGYLPKYIRFIDENYSNCKIENLKECSAKQLKYSAHPGICWDQFRCLWAAYLRTNHMKTHTGNQRTLWHKNFENEEDAIQGILNPFKHPIHPNGISKLGRIDMEWIVRFKEGNKRELLGSFKTHELALEAYYKCHEEYYGISWEQEVKNAVIEIRRKNSYRIKEPAIEEQEVKNALIEINSNSPYKLIEKTKNISPSLFDESIIAKTWYNSPGIEKINVVEQTSSQNKIINDTEKLENKMPNTEFTKYLKENLNEAILYLNQNHNAEGCLYFIERSKKDLELLKELMLSK